MDSLAEVILFSAWLQAFVMIEVHWHGQEAPGWFAQLFIAGITLAGGAWLL